MRPFPKSLLYAACAAALSACGQRQSAETPVVSAPLRESITVAQVEEMSFDGGPFKAGAKMAKYDPIEQAITIPSCQSVQVYLRRSSACPRIVWEKNKTPQLTLDLNYFGKDWLFMEGVKVAVGNHVISRAYAWDPAFSKQRDTGTSYASLHEWRTVPISDTPADVAAILTASDAHVRLLGKASYVDLTDPIDTAKTLSWAARIYTRYKDVVLVD
ncbi:MULTISPECIES: hypothetical protein [Cupriavidus]